ncbi:LysE family transporter [Clostridium fallax]|uniref:Threonine/homoserine/homoserine lactone efflux protein n=1 Tax=Clostridium fallax TaxID=1533 RepID=A0A1M4X224_9CLOT|nr:LysE family transporter [Clostridium fallax]SHE87546.1 Threonine/homoserine/homoserine lactone efflux protein [Clostridium fallax]SQB22542.1 putative threonine efflux protein [Clostridium fallax]
MNIITRFFIAVSAGFSTGFIYSIPLGPSGIESVNKSISKGFNEGFKVSVGAVLADVFYFLLINLGLANLLNSNPKTEGLFWVICGLILIIFGQLTKKNTEKSSSILKFKFLKDTKLGGIITGFFLTALNPMTPSLWLALSGTIIPVWRDSGTLYYFTAIISMIVGSLAWFAIINALACKGIKIFKKNQTTKTFFLLKYILIILGLGFIVFGLYKLIF